MFLPFERGELPGLGPVLNGGRGEAQPFAHLAGGEKALVHAGFLVTRASARMCAHFGPEGRAVTSPSVLLVVPADVVDVALVA
jgi:hypothetical protein